MRSVETIALLTAPLIAGAYLASATVYHRIHPVRGSEEGSDALDADPSSGERPERPIVPDAALEGGIALIATTIAWHVILRFSPGGRVSAIAAMFPQVLTVWQSVALWVGLAAVVGQIAPVWRRFRGGGGGIAPAAALLAAYAPLVLLVGLLTFFGAMSLVRSPRDALPPALVTMVVFEWLAWWFDIPPSWGMFNGPELALWCTILCGVVFAAWVRDGDTALTNVQ